MAVQNQYDDLFNSLVKTCQSGENTPTTCNTLQGLIETLSEPFRSSSDNSVLSDGLDLVHLTDMQYKETIPTQCQRKCLHIIGLGRPVIRESLKLLKATLCQMKEILLKGNCPAQDSGMLKDLLNIIYDAIRFLQVLIIGIASNIFSAAKTHSNIKPRKLFLSLSVIRC